MSENEQDPAANTQMFQAFVDRAEPEASGSRTIWVVIGVVAAAIVLVLAWLTLA